MNEIFLTLNLTITRILKEQLLCTSIVGFSFFLGGCSDQFGDNTTRGIEHSFFYNTDDMFYFQNATAKAVDSFFEPSLKDGTPTLDLGLTEISGNNVNVPVMWLYRHQAGITIRRTKSLSPRISLTTGGAISISETALLLPNGAGILIEPISLHYSSLIGEAQAELLHDFPISTRISAGVFTIIGIKAAISTARIDSPIVAIRQHSFFANPFTGVGAEISVSPRNSDTDGALVFGAELRQYNNVGRTLSAGISVTF